MELEWNFFLLKSKFVAQVANSEVVEWKYYRVLYQKILYFANFTSDFDFNV
jgi:hypothetical protein